MTTQTPGEAIVTEEMINRMRHAFRTSVATNNEILWTEVVMATGLPQRVRELEGEVNELTLDLAHATDRIAIRDQEIAALEARLQEAITEFDYLRSQSRFDMEDRSRWEAIHAALARNQSHD